MMKRTFGLQLGTLVLLISVVMTAGCRQSTTASRSVTGVTLNKSTLTLEVDSREKLIATVTPKDATNSKVTWSVDKADVAEVSQDGTVTAKKAGTATVTVKTEDGGKTAACTVKVIAKSSPPAPKPKHAITFGVDGGNGTLKAKAGEVAINSDDEVEEGKEVTFTAKANDGYRVKGWTLDGTAVNGTNDSYSLSVTKAVNVKVSFEDNSTPLPTHSVTFSVDGGHGTLKAKADGVAETEASPITVEEDKIVLFTAVPETGYEVENWEITGAGMVFVEGTGGAGNNEAKVELKADLTVKVKFRIQTTTPKHSVTMNAGEHGSIAAAPALPSDNLVDEGTTIVFTASAEEDYVVDTWNISGGQTLSGGNPGSSTAMVKITADTTVAVSFKLATYAVSFNVDGANGTLSAVYKEGGSAFASGTAVPKDTVLVFTASPETNYKVEKWTVNGTVVPGNITKTYEHTVTEAASVLVSFVSSISIPDNFTLSNGAEYKVADKAQKYVIMTKRENGVDNAIVYTVAVTVEYSGITYTLTGFSGNCINLPLLTDFALSGPSEFLSVDSGVLFDKAKTKLVCYPVGKTDTSYTVPASVKVLGESSFYNNQNLTSIVLPDGLTTVEDLALHNCNNLQTVNIPSTLTSIGANFLAFSKVENVIIPEGITELKGQVLDGCSALKTVELPSTLTQAEGYFCGSCMALKTVTCKALTPPALLSSAFQDVDLSGKTLKVPSGSVSAYENAYIWKDFKKPFEGF